MLTVEDDGRIYRAHRDQMSIREISQTFGHSRRKIREVLQEAEPQPYSFAQPRRRRLRAAASAQSPPPSARDAPDNWP